MLISSYWQPQYPRLGKSATAAPGLWETFQVGTHSKTKPNRKSPDLYTRDAWKLQHNPLPPHGVLTASCFKFSCQCLDSYWESQASFWGSWRRTEPQWAGWALSEESTSTHSLLNTQSGKVSWHSNLIRSLLPSSVSEPEPWLSL